MHVRILDLDGSLLFQHRLRRRATAVHGLRWWGPRLRLACSFGRFRRFQADVHQLIESEQEHGPALTFYGSGDFHHVTLALLRRLREPFNLLVLDNHPDWVRGVPLLHCGTWLYHAARLPQVRRIFHAGGDVDFDNGYRWLAPWGLLRSGKVVVLPAERRFRAGRWEGVAHQPLRSEPGLPFDAARLDELLAPYRAELARWPLYVSLDKDVLRVENAVVNWDSGRLTWPEVKAVLRAFRAAALTGLAGMDVLGDWSPVEVAGLLRRFLHLTEHPALPDDETAARTVNERTNLALLGLLGERKLALADGAATSL